MQKNQTPDIPDLNAKLKAANQEEYRKLRTPAYVESMDLMLQLHDLDERGRLQGPEADRIRDQMEDPHYQMSPEEQDTIDRLSADLYLVAERRAKL